MNEVVIIIGCLSSCPVWAELDVLEDATVILRVGEATAKLDCFAVTLGGIVRAAVYVVDCPPSLWMALTQDLANPY